MKNTFNKLFLISSLFLLSLAVESKAQLSYYSITITTNNLLTEPLGHSNNAVVLTASNNVVLLDSLTVNNGSTTNITLFFVDAPGAVGGYGRAWYTNAYAYSNIITYNTNILSTIITTTGVTNYITNRFLYSTYTVVPEYTISRYPTQYIATVGASATATWTNLGLVFTRGVAIMNRSNVNSLVTIGYKTLFQP